MQRPGSLTQSVQKPGIGRCPVDGMGWDDGMVVEWMQPRLLDGPLHNFPFIHQPAIYTEPYHPIISVQREKKAAPWSTMDGDETLPFVFSPSKRVRSLDWSPVLSQASGIGNIMTHDQRCLMLDSDIIGISRPKKHRFNVHLDRSQIIHQPTRPARPLARLLSQAHLDYPSKILMLKMILPSFPCTVQANSITDKLSAAPWAKEP